MADANTKPATSGDAPKKKRKAFTRQAKTLNILLTVDAEGNPVVELASYNAQDTLTAYVNATSAGKKVNLVTWQDKKNTEAATA